MPEFPTLKDIVERPEPFDVVPWVLAGIGFLLVLAALAWMLYPGWRRQLTKPNAPALTDPATAAIGELKILANTESTEIPKRVQSILRTYLHRRHGALGHFRTADELLGRNAPGAPPVPPDLVPFADVLRSAEERHYGLVQGDQNSLVSDAIAALENDPKTAEEAP
ncbi:MAG: hypothetical protein ACI9R3_004960 [Verrucomicrobiales bacterium]|jgi:hypothetical protein